MPLSAHAGLLGINGLTAYIALTELGRPVAGDTVLVSTAGGAVGAFVGQIARNLGARPLGLTGDDAKVELCRSRYGYDEAWNYKTTDWAAQLGGAAPGGVNVYFDNVGGVILDTTLRRMAAGGPRGPVRHRVGRELEPAPDGPAQRARDPDPTPRLERLRDLRSRRPLRRGGRDPGRLVR